MKGQTIAQLSNDMLIDRVGELKRRERTLTAVLVAHLVEVLKRRLYLQLGFRARPGIGCAR